MVAWQQRAIVQPKGLTVLVRIVQGRRKITNLTLPTNPFQLSFELVRPVIMWLLLLLAVSSLSCTSASCPGLGHEVVFQWKAGEIDYNWPNDTFRRRYQGINAVPIGIKVNPEILICCSVYVHTSTSLFLSP